MAFGSGNLNLVDSDGAKHLDQIITPTGSSFTYVKISAIKIGAKDAGAIVVGATGLTGSNYGYAIKVGESLELIFQTAVAAAQIFVRNPDTTSVKVAVIGG